MVVSLSIKNKNKVIRSLDLIENVFLEKTDHGFQIVLVHKLGGYHEKVLYRFNRYSFIEKS